MPSAASDVPLGLRLLVDMHELAPRNAEATAAIRLITTAKARMIERLSTKAGPISWGKKARLVR